MILAMIVLTGLATLSGLTVVSVQGGMATAGNDRFHAIALYAAESGGAAAIEYLRVNVDPVHGWQAFISAANATPVTPSGILGNGVVSGGAGNLFSDDMRASYTVQVLNNRGDPGFLTGTDVDKRIVLRSTGRGPNNAVAVIEWEIVAGQEEFRRPCPTYGQKNMSEDGAARNDCLSNINVADAATYQTP